MLQAVLGLWLALGACRVLSEPADHLYGGNSTDAVRRLVQDARSGALPNLHVFYENLVRSLRHEGDKLTAAELLDVVDVLEMKSAAAATAAAATGPITSSAAYSSAASSSTSASSTSSSSHADSPPVRAFDLLLKAAELGSPEAQHRLAAAYSSGIYTGLVPMDAGRALLLDYTAALSGSPEANIAMGYRYFNGIGVPESCELARKHYEFAANIAATQIETRRYRKYIDTTKLADVIESRLKKVGREIDDEVVDYYKYLAAEGDMSAAFTLGVMFRSGSRLLEQDHDEAIKYLAMASKSPVAAGQLAYLLIRGVGSPSVRKTFNGEKLAQLLDLSVKAGDAHGIVASGLAHQMGIGMLVNITRAVELFQSALSKHADAGRLLGDITMGKVSAEVSIDLATATNAYATAAAKGSILARHRLGHMSASGLGLPKHCPAAVSNFKVVAELGDWMLALTEAHRHFHRGDVHSALLIFSRFAVLGVESAQYNTAHILSKVYCPAWLAPPTDLELLPPSLRVQQPVVTVRNESKELLLSVGVDVDPVAWQQLLQPPANLSTDEQGTHANESLSDERLLLQRQKACEIRALQFLGLSAHQKDAEALRQIGDAHYYGAAGLKVNKMEAARFYQLAAELRNPHANFNLGIMHESGDGIEQDFHLAKRFFDQAAAFSTDATLPSYLALFFLSSHQGMIYVLGQDASEGLFRIVQSYLQWVAPFTDLAFNYITRNGAGLGSTAFSSKPHRMHQQNPSSQHHDANDGDATSSIFGTELLSSLRSALASGLATVDRQLNRFYFVLSRVISGISGASDDMSLLHRRSQFIENGVIVGLITILLLLLRQYRRRRERRARQHQQQRPEQANE